MVKSFTAFAVFALLGAAVVAVPSFASVKAGETVALAKSDRLDLKPSAANCVQQIWPNIEASCLRGADSKSFSEARLVTARR